VSRRGKPKEPARLPPDGEQGKLLLPGGEVMPVRVAESGDGILRLVYLLEPQTPLQAGGEPPVLEWSSARGVVRLAGKVVWEAPDLVRFEVQDMVDLQQRREHVRVHAPRPVVLEFEASGRELGTFAIDLSGGGVLLAGPDTLQIGDRLRFRLLLDGGASSIDGTGHVVRYGPGGYRAIAFSDVTAADRERLIRFIFEFERASRRVKSDAPPRGRGDGQG
jgi:PilZ domain-containing protein